MPDLGPHAAFIWAAYGATALAVAGLLLFAVMDDRRQRAILAELERQGITRRSAKRPAPPRRQAAPKTAAAKAPRKKPSRARGRGK